MLMCLRNVLVVIMLLGFSAAPLWAGESGDDIDTVSGAESAADVPTDQLTLLFDAQPSADLAPIYWAKQQGLYGQAGINLSLLTSADQALLINSVNNASVPLGIADLSALLQSRSQGSDIIAIMSLYNTSPHDPRWQQATGIKMIIANGPFVLENESMVRGFLQVTQQAYVDCATTPEPCVAVLAQTHSQNLAQFTEQWQQAVALMKTPNDYRRRGFGFLDPDRMRDAYTGVVAAGVVTPFEITDSYSNAYTDQTLQLPK